MSNHSNLFVVDRERKVVRFHTLFDIGNSAPEEPVTVAAEPFQQSNAPGNLSAAETLDDVCDRAKRSAKRTTSLFVK